MKKIGRPRSVNYEEVLKKIKQNLSAKTIATQMNISSAEVYSIARKNKVSVSPPIRQTKYPWNEILEYFCLTGNQIETAKKFGVKHPGNIQRTWVNGGNPPIPQKVGCPKTGRKVKPPGVGKGNNSPKKIHLDKIFVVRQYESGRSCKEIGDDLGIDAEVVRKNLVRWSIPRRIGKAVGPKNPQWKGGKEQVVHYYRRQSYEVAAICLGQPVPKGYVIHHLDENKENNNPENLVLFPSQSVHTKFHQKVMSLQLEAGSKEANQLALEIGAVPLPKPPHPLTFLQSKG